MGEYLLSGGLYANINGKTISLGDDLDFTREVDMWSADEHAQETYCFELGNSRSMSYDVNYADLEALNELTRPLMQPETFGFEYDAPIMIQSRWHKKKRINKKWLHRFGMKDDTVRVRKEGRVLTYDKYSGEVEFETTSNSEYIWRQDQLKKYLKMEWR